MPASYGQTPRDTLSAFIALPLPDAMAIFRWKDSTYFFNTQKKNHHGQHSSKRFKRSGKGLGHASLPFSLWEDWCDLGNLLEQHRELLERTAAPSVDQHPRLGLPGELEKVQVSRWAPVCTVHHVTTWTVQLLNFCTSVSSRLKEGWASIYQLHKAGIRLNVPTKLLTQHLAYCVYSRDPNCYDPY